MSQNVHSITKFQTRNIPKAFLYQKVLFNFSPSVPEMSEKGGEISTLPLNTLQYINTVSMWESTDFSILFLVLPTSAHRRDANHPEPVSLDAHQLNFPSSCPLVLRYLT